MNIPLVKIIYQDITSTMEGLKDLGECYRWFKEENDLITTVGWLLEKDKTSILIAASWDKKENEFNDLTKIPRGCIKEIRDLVIELDRPI